MKKSFGLFVRKAIDDQSGQILPWLAVVLIGMLGTAGLTIDVGRAYIAHSQLQNYANASALAAAGLVYQTSSTTNATTIANNYSASSGGQNVNSTLGTVTTVVNKVCVPALLPSGSCTGAPKNAVQVTQTATVPTTFMKLFGFNSLSVSSQATASMQGAAQQWNVAVILDATQSMSSAPASGSCTGYSSKWACAIHGVQLLLEEVQPCNAGTNCTSANSQFRVALFSFPNVATSNVSNFWGCGTKPTNEPYTLPLTNLTSYTTLTYGGTQSTYEDTPVNTSDGDVNGFVTDYFDSTSSNYLKSSSSIVKALGGCIQNPGGESTYYASVIYAAQAALTAEKAKYGGNNAIIILSDGQASADSSKFPTGNVTPSASGYNASAMTTTGYYPSTKDQCQQAIMAAQTAQTAGTKIFAVALGAESDGCGVSGGGATVTDTTTIATATSGQSAISAGSLTPCLTMKNMATPNSSTQIYFFADAASGSNGCTASGTGAVTDINSIIWAIGSNFTSPRLITNGAYS